jgi:hypothetical protein
VTQYKTYYEYTVRGKEEEKGQIIEIIGLVEAEQAYTLSAHIQLMGCGGSVDHKVRKREERLGQMPFF